MRETRSSNFIVLTAVIAILYVIAAVYLMNAGLVRDTIFGSHSVSYKWNLLAALLLGMWTAMSVSSLALLILVAVLTGANFALIVRRLHTIRTSGKVSFMIGGSSLLGIVASGCASCGLPLLALVGLGGATLYLPWGGVELSLLAVVLLIFSLRLLLKTAGREKVCTISKVVPPKT